MTYHQAFDRLGNQLPPPKPDWQNKLIQRAAWTTAVICLAILTWWR